MVTPQRCPAFGGPSEDSSDTGTVSGSADQGLHRAASGRFSTKGFRWKQRETDPRNARKDQTMTSTQSDYCHRALRPCFPRVGRTFCTVLLCGIAHLNAVPPGPSVTVV